MGKWKNVSKMDFPDLKNGALVVGKMRDGSKAIVIFCCCDFEYWFHYANSRRFEPDLICYRKLTLLDRFAFFIKSIINPQ